MVLSRLLWNWPALRIALFLWRGVLFYSGLVMAGDRAEALPPGAGTVQPAAEADGGGLG